MWGAEAGWWCGALAAAAVLLALAACRSRRKRQPHVQLVVSTRPLPPPAARAPPPLRPRPALAPRVPLAPRCVRALLSGSPADDPPPPPQIVIVRNPAQNTSTEKPSTSQTVPKLPLPEQFLHKRSLDYKYITIPRPLAQLNSELGADLTQESRVKKYSATRSPSLEKDEKSPFVSSAKSEEVFGFDTDSVRKLSEDNNMSSKEADQDSPGNLKRFKSVSTRLNMCNANEAHFENQQERLEMQNSPKLLDTVNSPRFFTPPETVSPMFFNEPSPKSVYYDSVRSPKFFPETPREVEVPQSPRALGDHLNRNGIEKPSSPRVLPGKPSPKVHSYNKENYFTFEQSCLDESKARPKKYGGRNSIERERFTPPADKDIRKYKRHNSCDTYKTVELNITKCDNKETDEDVVDCCAKMDAIEIDSIQSEEKSNELTPGNTAQARRQRLKSISLDSDNAKIIELNLGLPIAKQMKDQMNEAYKNDVSASCESMECHQITPTNLEARPCFKFDDVKIETTEEEPKSPDLVQKKCLRQSSDTQAFIDMPRFSPKEFEITITSEEGSTAPADTQMKPKSKNLRNLTIDLTIRDRELEKELRQFDNIYDTENKVKTPTLKVKATSLDSSDSVNLSLPQKKALEVPQNSISVPNTPKRQLKRILTQKNVKYDFCGGKVGLSSVQSAAEQRRLFMKGQDSGIYLREHHANLMLYQPGTSRMGSRTMGSFDENMQDLENTPEINVCGADSRSYLDPGLSLGSNLLNYKQNLSVSSTNLKTLPEGVPSDDFEPSAEDEKVVKKLYRRNSNQSLMLSTHSLQSSNCSLNSSGASCHNLATVRTSVSNFSLNDNRQKKLSLDRRDSNTSLKNTDHLTPTTKVICSSNTNISDTSKNCLLQRRGSNNSLTLNIQSLSRHSSNTSLNKEAKPGQKKGLLERRSSNTSLTLNINTSNPQLSVNRGLSVSNYNLNGSACNLSRYNSHHSIDNANVEPRKGILERRNSNTSLTLNVQPQEPRDIEIDESNLEEMPHRDKHRKSLSTDNLIPKSYKCRTRRVDNCAFGSHDNLWSSSYTEQDGPGNLTYVCGDQDNEIIYAVGRQDDPNFRKGFIKNITTKPLSPQSTSEDFRIYLANMQHLQNASSILTRKQLKVLDEVFRNGYVELQCSGPCCADGVRDIASENPQLIIPEIPLTCLEYQKMLLRKVHCEFWDLPTNFQEKPIVSGSHPKNRYKAILPNEHSRVILRADASNTEGYINANFIKGHEYTKNSYIATQGPLQNTMYDFWLMVHQNYTEHRTRHADDPRLSPVQKVVMLTNLVEETRYKCDRYFPLEVDEEMVIMSPDSDSKFTIKNCGVISKIGYSIRKFTVLYSKSNESDSEKSDSSEITVYHYWFDDWADHKCPRDVNALLRLSLEVLRDVDYDFEAPCDTSEVVYKCDSPKSASVDTSEAGYKCDSPTSVPVDTSEVLYKTDSPKSASVDTSEVGYKCDSPISASVDTSEVVYKCDSPRSYLNFRFPPLQKLVEKSVGSSSSSCSESNLPIPSPLDLSCEKVSPPIVVHCSAGVGRTGCLIGILNGIKQLYNEEKVDVLGIVCNMRLSRGGMVQNSEQYELVHKVICMYERLCLPPLPDF